MLIWDKGLERNWNMAQMDTKGLFLTRYAMWLILTQIELEWSWNEMVVKEAAGYTFCNNFANNRSTGLKFWHNMGTYKGHLWYEFQHPAALLWKLLHFLCVFYTLPILLIGGHNGPTGTQ